VPVRNVINARFTPPARTPAIYRARNWFPSGRPDGTGPLGGHAYADGALQAAATTQGEFAMKKITAVIAMMCALSAYASYPSATTSAGLSPLAMSMQESRSLPIEAYDAV